MRERSSGFYAVPGWLGSAGRNQATLAEGARYRVSGFRNGWPTYAVEY